DRNLDAREQLALIDLGVDVDRRRLRALEELRLTLAAAALAAQHVAREVGGYAQDPRAYRRRAAELRGRALDFQERRLHEIVARDVVGGRDPAGESVDRVVKAIEQ